MIFWTNQSKYSKSDDFARVYSIINHDLFWCQKPPETNLWMTLGLIFNHFFDKTHFGAFSVFYTNYLLIFGDKKIQNQKWCIREKFRCQKIGVMKGCYLVKFFDFWFQPLLGKMIAGPPRTRPFQSHCSRRKSNIYLQRLLWIFGT